MEAIMSESEVKAFLQKVIRYSKADACTVSFGVETRGNIRYANNEVSTSGSLFNKNLMVESAFGKKVGIATIDELDDASLEKVVRRSEELARLAPENPEYMPPLGPQEYVKTQGYFESTAAMNAAQRADMVKRSLKVADQQGLSSSGFLEHSSGFSASLNSKGLFTYYPATGVNFSLTVRTSDGTGSGYVIRGYNDINKLKIEEVTQIAVQKALGSVNAKALEPGKYTVILEPTAAAVLLENLYWDLDARSADEGRSSFSKAEGKNKIGEKIVDERVNIYSDPTHPELPGAPYGGDGLPQKRVSWIEKGVVKNLSYSRYWAQQKGVQPISAGSNMIMDGGNASLSDLIKGTKRGILVTKLWYIRSVDPQTLLLTGLTRDGTFLIEDGKIKHPIKNFRFNESPIIMLNNLEELGKPERVVSTESDVSYIVPPMKIREFTFTSLSDAV